MMFKMKKAKHKLQGSIHFSTKIYMKDSYIFIFFLTNFLKEGL